MRHSISLVLVASVVACQAESDLTPGATRDDIINGDSAPGSEFPFVGSLAFDGQIFCTGSLIAPRLVLTAAHCIIESNGGGPFLPDGTTFALDSAGGRTIRNVTSQQYHPLYRETGFASPFLINDVAVLRLDAPIVLAEYGRLAQSVAINERGTVVGYGTDENNVVGRRLKAQVRVSTLVSTTFPFASVPINYNEVHVVPALAGRPQKLCFGDSGGPLLNAQGQIVAVVSYANGVIGTTPAQQCTNATTNILSNAFVQSDWLRLASTELDPARPALVTGAGSGGGPHVKIFRRAEVASQGFFAYQQPFAGGVRVATGDVNGDGEKDFITGAGPGGGPHVRVFDGRTMAELRSFFAYDPAFRGGVYVASADMNGDRIADIVTGAGQGGGPHVRVFDGRTSALLHEFFAFDPSFTGGVRVAAGDLFNDGRAEILVASGPGRVTELRLFAMGASQANLSITPYAGFTGGANVALADLRGIGQPEILSAPDAGGGPHVRMFDALGNELESFFAFAPTLTTGLTLGATDYNGDGRKDLLAGTGAGTRAQVAILSGIDLLRLTTLFPYDQFAGGLFVGGN